AGRTPLSAIDLPRLRLFLSGPLREASSLARLMLCHVTGVVVARHANDADARYLAAPAVKPVGFADESAVLPYPEGSFRGYRALTEFSCLPEKFLFFDVETGPLRQTDRLELYIYFDTAADVVTRESMGVSVTLHATPAINLFATRAEPIALDGKRTNYPLQADARRPLTRQVHSVRRVALAGSDGSGEAALPFFHRLTDRQNGAVYWQLERHSEEDGHLPGATSIAFVDHRAQPLRDIEVSAGIEVLATNANLPRQLPFGGGQPRLRLATPVENVAAVSCLRAPSPLRRPKDKRDRNWQLISHLSLNHLSITGSGASALRAILRLYDPSDSPDLARMIDAIESVASTPGLAKIGGVIVAGTDVSLSFDSQRIEPGEAVFFGAVIDRFLGCYTTINTFTRLTLRFSDRTDTLARFAARSGEEALV
ncbi:MAG: type VI secretion system baseplate subunit TssF, partial [Tabrizicola sp.]|nr:type VI secretion system baseplate subunit TssF [Tabrizicola sp.]